MTLSIGGPLYRFSITNVECHAQRVLIVLSRTRDVTRPTKMRDAFAYFSHGVRGPAQTVVVP
jgi:hypothetical protein